MRRRRGASRCNDAEQESTQGKRTMLTRIRRNAVMLALIAAGAVAQAHAEDLMQIYQQARDADP